MPGAPPRVVVIVAVPEQVAVPLVSVAVVGAAVQAWPREVTVKVAPDQEPDVEKVTVAVDPAQLLLKVARVQVPVPLMVPPLAEAMEATAVGV